MIPIRHLGTAWTVWKVARKRVGPVGALIATVAVVGGMIYLTPRLTEKFPALAGVVGDAKRETGSSSE